MNYRTIKPLGTGATAITYLAADLRRGAKPVAKKVFNQKWSQQYRSHIDREFGLLSRLSHPYLVRVQDFGMEADRCFLITDYVAGKPLLEHLQGRSENTIYWYFAQLLEALDYLTFRNVVHLDLKPENIMIETTPPGGRDPHLKVLDFGLAAMALDPEGPGGAIGSPPFTAPEFSRSRQWDLRSDLYSFGALLYRALSGKNPFLGKDPLAILSQQWNESAQPIERHVPNLSPKMIRFIHSLLAANPDDRPASPRRALEEFRQILGGSLGESPAWQLSLFDDPDLNFRPEDCNSIFQKILHSSGIVGTQGPKSSGKTFLCRWLQRQLWHAKKNVLFLDGADLLLTDSKMVGSEDVVLIDNANLGPWVSWLQHSAATQAFITLEDTAKLPPDFAGYILPLRTLKKPSIANSIRGVFQEAASKAINKLTDAESFWPGTLVAQAQEMIRSQEFLWTQTGWVLNPNPNPQPENKVRETLLELLMQSRIALDLPSLASWIRCSQEETEIFLEELAQERKLIRECREGTVLYRGISNLENSPSTLSPDRRDAILQQLLNQGRFVEGLELLDQTFPTPLDNETKLLRAEYLAGAQRLPEAKEILTPALLKALSNKSRTKAHELLGKVALFSGNLTEAQAQLGLAETEYAAQKNEVGQTRCLLHLGIWAQRSGNIPEAQKYYEQVIALAENSEPSPLLAGVGKLNLGNLFYDRGEYTQAKPLYEASIKLLETSGHGPVLAQAYLNNAHLNYYLGDTFAAEACCREAIRRAIQHRYPPTQGYALLLMALLDQNRDQPDRQGLRLAEALEIFAMAELSFEWVQAKINQAYYFDAQGQLQAAEQAAREALKRAQDIHSPDLEAKSQLVLGKTLRQNSNKLTEAADVLKIALNYFSKVKNEEVQWQVEFELGEVERRKGNREAAKFLFSQSEKTLESLLAKLPPGLQESYLRDKKIQMVQAAKGKLQQDKK